MKTLIPRDATPAHVPATHALLIEPGQPDPAHFRKARVAEWLSPPYDVLLIAHENEAF